jgi:hypothetical protein
LSKIRFQDLEKVIKDFKTKGIYNANPSNDDGLTAELKFPKLLSNCIVEHTDQAAKHFIGNSFFDDIEWILKRQFPER